jgi:hypothetical protein
MIEAKTETNTIADYQAGQSTLTEVSPDSSSVTERTSLHRVARNPGSPTDGLSPLGACIFKLAEFGRQRLAREALAMSEDVGDELPADTNEKLN